jgi:DNA mismatch repair protein MutS
MITIVLFRRFDLQKDYAFEILTKHFQTVSKGLVLPTWEGVIASGAILYYLSETQHNKVQHITTIQRISKMLMYGWIDLRFESWIVSQL